MWRIRIPGISPFAAGQFGYDVDGVLYFRQHRTQKRVFRLETLASRRIAAFVSNGFYLSLFAYVPAAFFGKALGHSFALLAIGAVSWLFFWMALGGFLLRGCRRTEAKPAKFGLGLEVYRTNVGKADILSLVGLAVLALGAAGVARHISGDVPAVFTMALRCVGTYFALLCLLALSGLVLKGISLFFVTPSKEKAARVYATFVE